MAAEREEGTARAAALAVDSAAFLSGTVDGRCPTDVRCLGLTHRASGVNVAA